MSTGASLTLLTLRLACATVLEKAELPPLVVVSAVLRVPPTLALPLLWSQARKLSVGEPPFWPSGTKRNWLTEDSNSAALPLTAPTLNQSVPSVEYCQVPLPLLAVTAMPMLELSGSLADRSPSRLDTVTADEVASSLVAVHT
ncbi:hypothetical protein D9M68_785200 [compost metagenome]